MDLLSELECMAANVSLDEEVTQADIVRWQNLFGFSSQEAQQKIKIFRSDLGRTSISEELWLTQMTEQEALGHNKESFEFSLALERVRHPSEASNPGAGSSQGTYIVRLEGVLDSVEAVQSVLGTQRPPEVLIAHDADDQAARTVFCKVSALERASLLDYVSRNLPGHQLTSVRLAKAVKDLGTHSRAPCLGRGMEWMLPHLRPSTQMVHKPAQNDYPVWYFFYGKLADPQTLRALLALDTDPILIPATVQGGTIKSWGRRYNAMVDSAAEERVTGSAYRVISQEHEEALQFFETDMYEVVRCSIAMGRSVVDGLVFRYCGAEEQLS